LIRADVGNYGPMEHDIVVIGGGPAGVAAATWAARYRRSVALVDRGEPRNRWAAESHGYLGDDPVAPRTLMERAMRDLRRYPVEVCEGVTAIDIRTGPDVGFHTTLANGSRLASRRVILATGVQDDFPAIENFFDHYGKSVHHCPACDGYEARGTDVAVIGWSEHIAGFALGLLDWARSVTIVTDGHSFGGDAHHRRALRRHGVSIVEGDVVRFVGQRGDLESLELRGGDTIDCQQAFFSIRHRVHDALAKGLGCDLTDEGCVVVDGECRTSVDGVFAAGDLTPGLQLVQVAAAKGAIAGVAAAQSLRGEAGAARSPLPAPDPAEELRPPPAD
jgi:thioredoxin reductase